MDVRWRVVVALVLQLLGSLFIVAVDTCIIQHIASSSAIHSRSSSSSRIERSGTTDDKMAATTTTATTPTTGTEDSTTATTAGTSSSTKTIYFIRHAESEENRRLQSIQSMVKSLTRFQWPKSNDVTASMEFLQLSQQIDSNVSEFGHQQIAHMGQILSSDNFISNRQIQLVAHSPLIRAKQTCLGMLGCTADSSNQDGTTTTGHNDNSILQGKVYELELLREKTPAEWIPGNSGKLYERIHALEEWIGQRPESIMVLVGHSQYFKAMLQMDTKLNNCDVISAQFHTTASSSLSTTECPNNNNNGSGTTSRWSNIQPEYLCQLSKPSSSSSINNDDEPPDHGTATQ